MRVAIAGYGTEGRASFDYYKQLGYEVAIADEREELDDAPEGANLILGSDAFSKLDGFDLVIRTPGLAPSKIKTDGKVWSATNEFFAKCPAPIIGVTGTKGKGTTCSLITSMLRAAGKTVHLLGNIGTPALEQLPKITKDDIVVYELSSFQLWDFTGSPDVAVILMVEPDHLDVHSDMLDYAEAKANLVRSLKSDAKLYFYSKNELSTQIAGSGSIIPTPYAVKRPDSVYFSAGYIRKAADVIAPAEAIQLPGIHNIDNVCAAVSAALNFTGDYQAIEQGIRDFKGLPHRLQYVDQIAGIRFYNDSIATTPGSAMAAIKSFPEPKIIILGGADKGADYSNLIALCSKTNTDVIAIGENREKIKRLCDLMMVFCAVDNTGDMKEIVRQSMHMGNDEGVVILSPASASFDMFKSYQDRGQQFMDAVKHWGGK